MRMLYRVRLGDFDLALDLGEALTDTGMGSWSSQVVSALRCARTGRGDRKAARQAARSFRLTTGVSSLFVSMAIISASRRSTLELRASTLALEVHANSSPDDSVVETESPLRAGCLNVAAGSLVGPVQ